MIRCQDRRSLLITPISGIVGCPICPPADQPLLSRSPSVPRVLFCLKELHVYIAGSLSARIHPRRVGLLIGVTSLLNQPHNARLQNRGLTRLAQRRPHKPSDCSCAPRRVGQFSVPTTWVACDMYNMRKACLHERGQGVSRPTAAAHCLLHIVLILVPWYGSRQLGPCGHEAKLTGGCRGTRDGELGSADHFPISPRSNTYRGHSDAKGTVNCSPSGPLGPMCHAEHRKLKRVRNQLQNQANAR